MRIYQNSIHKYQLDALYRRGFTIFSITLTSSCDYYYVGKWFMFEAKLKKIGQAKRVRRLCDFAVGRFVDFPRNGRHSVAS